MKVRSLVCAAAAALAVGTVSVANADTISTVVAADTYTQEYYGNADMGGSYWVDAMNYISGSSSYMAHGWQKYNAASIVSGFNTLYGVDGWEIDEVSLVELICPWTYATSSGVITMYHNTNDAWAEGTHYGGSYSASGNVVCWNNEATYLGTLTLCDSVNTNWKNRVQVTYDATNSAVINDIMGGGYVSFYYTAGTQTEGGFSSKESSYQHPVMVVSAHAVPEPGSILALASGLLGLVGFTTRRRK